MSDDRTLFSAEQHLRLLQLWTRRAMADRREQSAAAPRDTVALVTPGADHALWRLVPEGVELYEWQKQCLALWIPQARGTVKVATGGGKTLFALAAAQALQNERDPELRLVIVVPSIPLMYQWLDDIRRGNVPDSAIGLMGGGRELPPPHDVRVLVCVINSARERLPQYVTQGGWRQHMMLVVDECHRASAARAQRIFDSRPSYTLGLSATPEQDAADEMLPSDEAYAQGAVGQALGPIIFDFSLRMSLEAGLLTPFDVLHVGLPLTPHEATEHGKLSREISDLRKPLQAVHQRSRSQQGFIAWCQTQASRGGPNADSAGRFIGLSNRRKDLLYRAEARGEVALSLLADVVEDPDSRAIVFHERVREIECLYLAAEERRLPAVLEHSKLPEPLRADSIDAFRRGIARIIVSAKSLVEGFNVPSADVGVIAASSSSVRQRIQSLGRMLRKKEGERTAQIWVLYVADTEDESIYEKADWESVIGASRNVYYRWSRPESGSWADGLVEQRSAPRPYRPPSSQVNADELIPGSPYPGRAHGVDLKVDDAGNLRRQDGELVAAPPELIAAIATTNPNRRARVTPAGHLITRADAGRGAKADWRFLGRLDLTKVPADPAPVAQRLVLRQVAGRRVISCDERGSRGARFARGVEESASPDAADALDKLLRWIATIEAVRGLKVRVLCSDNAGRYWVEIGGDRIAYDGLLPALEF